LASLLDPNLSNRTQFTAGSEQGSVTLEQGTGSRAGSESVRPRWSTTPT